MVAKPDTCKGCMLYTVGESFVMGEGPPFIAPSFIIIGEAPGQQEAAQGRPFVGGAGRVANSLLMQAGISRTRCYVTNIIKCRPPNNVLTPYLPEAANYCRQYLDKELMAYAGVPLILFGEVALRFILGARNITRHRGCVSNWDSRLVIPTIHPAALMREPKSWPIVVSDLEYAKTMQTQHKVLPREFVIQPTFQQVLDWFDTFVSPRDEPYFPDIETYGNSLACIGIAADETHAICIPWWENQQWYWQDEEQGIVVTGLVRQFLVSPGIPKVFQNGMFDIAVLEEYGFQVNGWRADTMIMHHTVYSEMKHSLAFLHSIYVREPYYKGMVHADKDELEE